MTNPDHLWYYTAAAVKQWLAHHDLPDDDGGPNWDWAEQSLCALSHEAREVGRKESGATLYRAKATVRGKRRRVEMTVSHARRDEGSLPQLIWVHVR